MFVELMSCTDRVIAGQDSGPRGVLLSVLDAFFLQGIQRSVWDIDSWNGMGLGGRLAGVCEMGWTTAL